MASSFGAALGWGNIRSIRSCQGEGRSSVDALAARIYQSYHRLGADICGLSSLHSEDSSDGRVYATIIRPDCYVSTAHVAYAVREEWMKIEAAVLPHVYDFFEGMLCGC